MTPGSTSTTRQRHWRRTTQELLPARRPPSPEGYDLYPTHPLPTGSIRVGYRELARELAGASVATLDGYAGVLWEELREQLDEAFAAEGRVCGWLPVQSCLLPVAELERLAAPYLGGDDPLFGTRYPGSLADLFDPAGLRALAPDPAADVNIVYGCGASLAGWKGPVVYVDLPKNELQFRARAGIDTNLFGSGARPPKESYKRSYFFDWPILNRHKQDLLPRLDLIVDGQRPDEPTFARGDAVRQALAAMARSSFRVRPWFEPGPWGGQWIRANIPGLPQDVPNYAWSFELIVPENGLLFESDGLLLETSFDLLMFQESAAVLGEAAPRFGAEFPIRFDFLDTVDGGNLSLQVHPRPSYIREHFGESFTQDETYYILDCAPGAEVMLGFVDGVDPQEFRAALERSHADATGLDVERFVQIHPAAKHDLFLIPSGTVHCSGEGNLVLEISATPYIFTFKMYDWLRLDLDGRPRPLNIPRAFENLRFERQGSRASDELISRPQVLDEGKGWRLVHLPTHHEHFYDVHRFEFERAVDASTDGSCHVMSLVEGTALRLELANGRTRRYAFAETFVVPAAAGGYRLVNEGSEPAKVVKAFVKPGRGP